MTNKVVPSQEFEFLKISLATCFERQASSIRSCETLEEVSTIKNKHVMSDQYLYHLANVLIDKGVTVKTRVAFIDGLKDVGKAFSACWSAIEKAYLGGGCEALTEKLVSGIGKAMGTVIVSLVKTLHIAIMGMLKAGVIIALKGAAGVLLGVEGKGTKDDWYWLTIAGAVTGAVVAGPTLCPIVAGAVAGTAVVGVARWWQRLLTG